MSIEKDPQENAKAAQQAANQNELHDQQDHMYLNKENDPDQRTDQAQELEQEQEQHLDHEQDDVLAPHLTLDSETNANIEVKGKDAEDNDDQAQGTGDHQPDEEEDGAIESDAANQNEDKPSATADETTLDAPEPDAELPAPKPKSKRKKKAGKTAEVLKPVKILHMVFDQAGGEQIKQSFELEPANAGDILYIEDNYSLGPVADLSEAEGWQARKNWWQSVLGLPEDVQPEVMRSDKMKLHQLFQQLEEDEDTVLWIWMGQNERDVAGYYYIISYLMEFQGRINVLYLNNLPFIDEKGHIFYPKQLSEIQPKEFVKAARLARVVTLSEFELDPEEWDKLSKSPGPVRLLEGGKKLSARENDYYDKIILDQLGSATMKLSKLLGLLTSKAKLGVPEYYIIWRIKSLIETAQVISQGEFEKGPKNVSLKATQGQLFVELNPEESEEGDGV